MPKLPFANPNEHRVQRKKHSTTLLALCLPQFPTAYTLRKYISMAKATGKTLPQQHHLPFSASPIQFQRSLRASTTSAVCSCYDQDRFAGISPLGAFLTTSKALTEVGRPTCQLLLRVPVRIRACIPATAGKQRPSTLLSSPRGEQASEGAQEADFTLTHLGCSMGNYLPALHVEALSFSKALM